jgi:hypothetical protein
MGITGKFAQIDYWNDNPTIADVHPVSQPWKLLSNIDMSNIWRYFYYPPLRDPRRHHMNLSKRMSKLRPAKWYVVAWSSYCARYFAKSFRRLLYRSWTTTAKKSTNGSLVRREFGWNPIKLVHGCQSRAWLTIIITILVGVEGSYCKLNTELRMRLLLVHIAHAALLGTGV